MMFLCREQRKCRTRRIKCIDNKIEHEGIAKLCEALTVNSTVTELNLNCDSYSDWVGMRSSSSVCFMNLTDNKLTNQGISLLSESLMVHTMLAKLCLYCW